MQEIWKDIKGYENLYQVSNKGNIKSLAYNREHILLPSFSGKYYSVLLSKDNKQKRIVIHRLVAKTFISNPENKPQVNHIDGNKLNNCVNNLEWCTNRDNCIHAIKNGLSNPKIQSRNKTVSQYDLDNNYINTYISLREAGRKNNIHNSLICMVCKGNRKTAGRYIWKYV